jgi:polyphenol oxidase
VIERRADSCEYLQFGHLAAVPGLTHAVFTRRGGFSAPPFAELNLSFTTGDDPAAVQRNRATVVAALGMPLVGARPVHGATVVTVRPGERSGRWQEELRARLRPAEADAMISDEPGFALCWAYGDCAPVLLYDPPHHAFALVHAGWRGAAAAVVLEAIAAMAERYGTRPADLLAGVGPCIRACCYEAGEHMRAAFRANPLSWESARFAERARPDGAPGLYLDVGASNYGQLVAAGVPEDQIEDAGYCTGCRTDLFYSHRCEPKPSGRFAVAIGLCED